MATLPVIASAALACWGILLLLVAHQKRIKVYYVGGAFFLLAAVWRLVALDMDTTWHRLITFVLASVGVTTLLWRVFAMNNHE